MNSDDGHLRSGGEYAYRTFRDAWTRHPPTSIRLVPPVPAEWGELDVVEQLFWNRIYTSIKTRNISVELDERTSHAPTLIMPRRDHRH